MLKLFCQQLAYFSDIKDVHIPDRLSILDYLFSRLQNLTMVNISTCEKNHESISKLYFTFLTLGRKYWTSLSLMTWTSSLTLVLCHQALWGVYTALLPPCAGCPIASSPATAHARPTYHLHGCILHNTLLLPPLHNLLLYPGK